jgi:hypothetical protein
MDHKLKPSDEKQYFACLFLQRLLRGGARAAHQGAGQQHEGPGWKGRRMHGPAPASESHDAVPAISPDADEEQQQEGKPARQEKTTPTAQLLAFIRK